MAALLGLDNHLRIAIDTRTIASMHGITNLSSAY